MTTAKKSGPFVLIPILALLTFCVELCQGDLSTCEKWTSIAKTMTENEYGSCTNNATSICTRYDCEGVVTERLTHLIEIDYCFGIQLNSCLEPLSMDFYLKIPSLNFTSQYRITHDQVVYISDLGIPELKHLPAKPLLAFELERDGSKSVLVSVTIKVRSTIFPIYFDQFNRKIVDEEELPIMPCAGPLTQDTTNKPADDFMSVPCHVEKYPAKVITPSQNVKSSDTINKTCDFFKGCSQGETCQITSEKKGMCVCEPDYRYVETLKACVSESNLGLECQSDGDCGTYEKCQRDAAKSNKLYCQCEESYKWDETRRLCILSSSKHKPHTHNPDDDHKHHTPGTENPTTTATPTTEKPSNHTGVDAQKNKTSSSSTKYIIIAASSVGGVVLIAGVVAGLLLCRHRRRSHLSISSGGLYDSDTPMLADTDDDVDLVM